MNRSDNGSDRRGFLKRGAAGLGAMFMFPAAAQEGSAQGEQKTPAKAEDRAMVTRPFGKTGITMPVISMGCGACDNPEVVRAALDAGIVLLDTAWNYGNGANEKMIAGVIKDRPRESFAVLTKIPGGPENRRTGVYTAEAKAGPFIEKFEESLERLELDHVDILMQHCAVTREAVLWEEYLSALQKMKDEGKTRLIGVSTHSNEPEVIRAVAESNVYDAVLTAYNFRQPHVAEMKKAIAAAAKAGVGVIGMKVLAGVYWDRERKRMINPKAALKWVLQDENVHTTIPGLSTFDQLEATLSVMEDLKLTPEESKDLDMGADMGLPGLYCPQCNDCAAQCPKGVDVPTLMRSYMYAYGYRNLRSAKFALDSAALSGAPCDDCESCSVSCRMGFDVRDRARDIARLAALPRDFVA
jgi:predicted aldo/keto reductase-like oxidoreductase